jgi:hypothetical protein
MGAWATVFMHQFHLIRIRLGLSGYFFRLLVSRPLVWNLRLVFLSSRMQEVIQRANLYKIEFTLIPYYMLVHYGDPL